MIFRTLLCIFCACLLGACANHSTFALRALDGAESIRTQQNGVSIFVKPFINSKDLQNYFDADLIKKGILPVQVHILNESDSAIGISIENIALFSKDGIGVTTVESSDAYKNLKSGHGTTIIHALTFGITGLLVSAENVAAANLKLDSDLQSKLLKSGIVQRHRYADGVVFFPVEKNTRSLAGWHLSIMVHHKEKKDTFSIKVPL